VPTPRDHSTGWSCNWEGLLIVAAMVDELIYNETGNEVLLIKYMDALSGQHEVEN
jgi:hypothetical protein